MSESNKYDAEKLADLLAKVKVAHSPDDEIDRALWFLVMGLRDVGGRRGQKPDGTRVRTPTYFPFYTASVDASLGAVRKLLPGWMWKVGTCHVSDDAWLCPNFNDPVHGERLRAELDYANLEHGGLWDGGVDIARVPAGQPALAVCEALLTALSTPSPPSNG
jgi:hypothetical protein